MEKEMRIGEKVVSNFTMARKEWYIELDNGVQKAFIHIKDYKLLNFKRTVYEEGNFLFFGNKKDLKSLLIDTLI